MPIKSDLHCAINQQPVLSLYLDTMHYETSVTDSNFLCMIMFISEFKNGSHVER